MTAQIKYGILLPPDVDLESIQTMLQNPGFEMLELKFAGNSEDTVQNIPLLLYNQAGFRVGGDKTDIQTVMVGINTQTIFDTEEKFFITSKIRNLLDVCHIKVLSVHPDWILFISET